MRLGVSVDTRSCEPSGELRRLAGKILLQNSVGRVEVLQGREDVEAKTGQKS